VKKRVLQFIGSFHQGGSERQAVALTRLLKADATFDVFAATLNKEGVLLPEVEHLGLEIPEFPLTSFYNKNFITEVRRCARYLTDNKVDLVHTHDFYTNVFGMAAATLAGGKARVASKRETGEMRSRGQDMVERLAFGRADRVVVNSSAVREYLGKRGVPAEKTELIYNGLDLARFEPVETVGARERFGLPIDPTIRFVTLVANLRHRVKNVPMLLRAAARLSDLDRVHFIIAGEGELLDELQAETASQGVAQRVHFTGRCDDVPTLLSISEACVLTSTAEGFSNSILEYMAAAKPVVATDVGGASEAIVEGETGYLVASDDDLAMAVRLTELLTDEGKAARMGAAGRRRVEAKFSCPAQLASTIGLYNSLLLS
jgi:L-malate glycosyltransferase